MATNLVPLALVSCLLPKYVHGVARRTVPGAVRALLLAPAIVFFFAGPILFGFGPDDPFLAQSLCCILSMSAFKVCLASTERFRGLCRAASFRVTLDVTECAGNSPCNWARLSRPFVGPVDLCGPPVAARRAVRCVFREPQDDMRRRGSLPTLEGQLHHIMCYFISLPDNTPRVETVPYVARGSLAVAEDRRQSSKFIPRTHAVCSPLVPTIDGATGSSKHPNAQQVSRKIWAASAKLGRYRVLCARLELFVYFTWCYLQRSRYMLRKPHGSLYSVRPQNLRF